MKKLISILLFISLFSNAQSLDYDAITKSKPIKVSGQVSASGVYYSSNRNNSREPFTYFLQGLINVNIFSFSVPISYSFSNQGESLGYQLPFNFNRLSLHPKYKWVTGHIGNVNMTFSPYTLSGHQFTGAGIDLTPSGDFEISAMTGRLLKATEDDADSRTIPAYNRMGYGIKTSYKKERYKVGIIGFYAKDDVNSLDSIPEAKGVLPQENLVISLEAEAKLGKSFNIQAEYASTAITKDTRAEEIDNVGFSPIAPLFNNRASTEYYTAIRARFGYAVGRINVGVGYERIDPGYETLGAYFFNNDFENITLDASNMFFNDKLSVAANIGFQRDNLDNLKANNTNRTVGSLNANLIVSKRLNIMGTYSNFSTFTNIEPNQFDEINDGNLLDEQIEDLDYKQLSQMATFTVNYILSNKKNSSQNLTANYSLNDVSNEQGGIVRLEDASTFHNMNIGHNVNFTERNFTINTSINGTYNTIGKEESTTWGPTISLAKRYFNKTLNTRFSASYNSSKSIASKTNVTNFRGAITYTLKKQHHFNINLVQLFRNGGNYGSLNEFTATFGYNYAFGLKKPVLPKRKPKEDSNIIRITYKKYHFVGTPEEITQEIKTIIPQEGKNKMAKQKIADLELLMKAIENVESKPKKEYKERAIIYLEALYEYEEFLKKYDQWIYAAYLKLIDEAEQIDSDLYNEYIALVAQVNTFKKKEDIEELISVKRKYEAHKVMLNSIIKWNLKMEDVKNPKGELKKLKETYLSKVYVMFKNNKPELSIINYIEIRLADLYHNVLEE